MYDIKDLTLNKLFISRELCLFYAYNFLDNYLNSDIGASSSKMYEIIVKYINNIPGFNEIIKMVDIDINNIINLLNIYINKNYIEIEDFIIEDHTPRIININKESHSMKLIYLYHGDIFDEFILVNSGKDKEENTIFTHYKVPTSKINNFIKIIQINRNIRIIYNKINMWKDMNLIESPDFIKFEKKLCPVQQSGSCTYFSTLYSIFFLIYNLSGDISIDKKIKLGVNFKDSLNFMCLFLLQDLYLNDNSLLLQGFKLSGMYINYNNYLFLRVSELIYKKNDLSGNDLILNYINIIKNKIINKPLKIFNLENNKKEGLSYNVNDITNVNYEIMRKYGVSYIITDDITFNDNACILYNDFLAQNYNNILKGGLNLFHFLAFVNKMIRIEKYIEIYVIFVKVLEDEKINYKIGIHNITNFHLSLLYIIKNITKKTKKLFYGLFLLLIFLVFDNVIIKENNIKMGLYNDETELIYNNYDDDDHNDVDDDEYDRNEHLNLNYNEMNKLNFCNITMYKKVVNYLYKYRKCITLTNNTDSDKDELVIQDTNNNIIFMTHYRILLDTIFNKKVKYSTLPILPGIYYGNYIKQKKKILANDKFKFYYSNKSNESKNNLYHIRKGYIYIKHNTSNDHDILTEITDVIAIDSENKYSDMYYDDYGTLHEICEDDNINKINNTILYDNIDDNIEYLYVNPFDILLSDENSLSNLLYTNHRLLSPKFINNYHNTHDLYCYLYNNSNNDIINYYDDSLNIFTEMLSNINIRETYARNKTTLCLIYIYSLFYELDNNKTYENILNYLRNIYCESNNDIIKKNIFLGILKNKITIKNIQELIIRINNQDNFQFIDLVTINYLKNEIFIASNFKQNKLHINNIQQTKKIINNIKYTYIYKYEKNEYITNNTLLSFINENENLKTQLINYYNTFIDINNDGFIYNFSNIYPALKTINRNMVLLQNEKYILQNNNTEELLNEIYILYNHALIFQKNMNDQIVYYNYIKYDTNNALYITKINKKIYIYGEENDDNLIITNTSNLIKNISNIFNFDIILTKNKMIITSCNLIKNLRRLILKDNLFGVNIDINLDEYYEKLKYENKYDNLYFEYNVITKEYNNEVIIHDIIMTDKIHAYILLIILARTYDYELLMKLYNKFLSILNPYIVYIYTNHPYSYIMHKKIIDNYRKNKIHDIYLNLFKYSEIINDDYEIIKYFNADILFDKEEKFGGRKLQNNNRLIDYFINNDNFEGIVTINNPYLNTMKKINGNFEYRIINTDDNIINQEHCIFSILNNIIKKNSVTYEMMMGFGKSKVIIPNVCMELIFNDDKKQILIVLPEHLANDMYESFNEISQYFSLYIVKYMKNMDDQNFLGNVINGIIITSDITLKTILINSSSNTLLFSPIKNNRIMIVDEIDNCINPKTSALNLRLDENFVYNDMKHFDKIVMFIIEYCLELQQYKDDTYCENYKKIIYSKKVTNTMNELLVSICGYSDDEIDNIEAENKNVYKTYKNKVLIYILKKIYDVTTLFEKNVFIYNKDYGLGNNPDKLSYYYAIPYADIDIPMNDSEFNDIYLTLFSTIHVYLDKTFKLRTDDYDEIRKKIINDDITNTLITYNNSPCLSEDEIKNIKNNQINTFESIDIIRLKIFYINEIISKKIVYIKSYKNTSFLEVFNSYISDVRIAMTGTPEYIGKLPNPINNDELIFPVIGNQEIFKSDINADYSTKKHSLKLSNQFFSKNTSIKLNQTTIFNHIKKTNAGSIHKIRAFIDAGAVFRFKSQEEYAIDFINELNYSDVFYFKKDNNLYHLYKDKTDLTKFISELIGPNKNKQIEKIRDDINFIIFYDNIHTRGTDIKLPSKTHGLITVSKFNDSVSIEQSMFRLRELGQLDSKNNITQTCEFIIDSDIKDENIQGDLYKYLRHQTEIYNMEQITELLVQTIYANSKWTVDNTHTKYNNIPIQNILYPDENESNDNLKTLLNYRYSLKSKLNNYCDNYFDKKVQCNANLICIYCGNIVKYMKKSLIDISNSTSTTTNTTTSININSNHFSKALYFYKNRQPYGLSTNSPYAVYNYNKNKLGYLAYITYLYLDNVLNHRNIYKNYYKKLLTYFIKDNVPIHFKSVNININDKIDEYDEYIEKCINLLYEKINNLQNFYDYFLSKKYNYTKLENLKYYIDDIKKIVESAILLLNTNTNLYNNENNYELKERGLTYMQNIYFRLKNTLDAEFNLLDIYPNFTKYIYEINVSYEYKKYIKENPSALIGEIIKNDLIKDELEKSIILYNIVENIFDDKFKNYVEFVDLVNLMYRIISPNNKIYFNINIPNPNILDEHIKIMKYLEKILIDTKNKINITLNTNHINLSKVKNAIDNLKFNKYTIKRASNIIDTISIKLINTLKIHNYESISTIITRISKITPCINKNNSQKLFNFDDGYENQNEIVKYDQYINGIIYAGEIIKNIVLSKDIIYLINNNREGYIYDKNLNIMLKKYYEMVVKEFDDYYMPRFLIFEYCEIITKIDDLIGLRANELPELKNYESYLETVIKYIDNGIFIDNNIKSLINTQLLNNVPNSLNEHYVYINNMIHLGKYVDNNIIEKYNNILNDSHLENLKLAFNFDIYEFINKKIREINLDKTLYHYLDDNFIIEIDKFNKMIDISKKLSEAQKNNDVDNFKFIIKNADKNLFITDDN
jgi:hypothetical protein